MSINRINNHPEMVEQEGRDELIDRLAMDTTEWYKGNASKPLTVKDAEFWDGDMGIIDELYKGKHWSIGDKVTFPPQRCKVYGHEDTAGEIVDTGMSGDYGSALVRAIARPNELASLLIVPNRDLVEEPWTDISADRIRHTMSMYDDMDNDKPRSRESLVGYVLNLCSQFKASCLRFAAKGRTRQDKSNNTSID